MFVELSQSNTKSDDKSLKIQNFMFNCGQSPNETQFLLDYCFTIFEITNFKKHSK